MSRIDWSEVDWWDLPGPARFLATASDLIASDRTGLTELLLPGIRRPKRLFEALAGSLDVEFGLRTWTVDVRRLDANLSPPHALAALAGAQPGAIRSAGDFVSAAELADAVFILDGIPPESWSKWRLFLRTFRSERGRSDRLAAPRLALVRPSEIPVEETTFIPQLRNVRWSGIVSRNDMQLFIESKRGPGDDLVHRTAVATITETACWDPDLAEQLLSCPIRDQLNPFRLLTELGLRDLGVPCWSNGLVEFWDGEPHVHTLSLLETRELLARRIWRAHVGAIFPAVELVRQAFVRRYVNALAAQLPMEKRFHETVRTYTHPLELEINDVAYFLRDELPADERNLIHAFKALRKSMAHMEPAEPGLIERASNLWAQFVNSSNFQDEAFGWSWPRCGQRLVMLIGPSCAGKSTYAANTYLAEEILSSDEIRVELFGSMSMAGSQQRVFEVLRNRAMSRLSTGRSVVIDATNIHQRDRLANASIVPSDLPVEYILIDRPMDEKQRDAGWRAEKPQLLENHANAFARELPDILTGDNLPNVVVHDLRAGAATT